MIHRLHANCYTVAKQYLVDSCDFVIDRSKGLVNEDHGSGFKAIKAVGRLGFCDEVNGNRRIYTRKVWEANFKDGSLLRKRLAENKTFGLLEHPADGQVSLLSPISHIVTSALLNEDGSISGELVFLDTSEGRKIQALIAAGYNPTVSSRGYGSLVKNSEGIDVVQDDYICEGWDVVMTPSFSNAIVQPVGESKKISKLPSTSVVESSIDGAKTPVAKQTPKNTMDANQIRQSLQSFAGLEVSKLTPQRYAEGMRQMETLHQHVEAWCSEDTANRRWDGTRLHEEITATQNIWSSAIAAPTAQVERLNVEKQKLLSVTEKIVQTGVALKNKLKESLDANTKLMEINQRNLARGRAWKQFAEGVQVDQSTLGEKYDVATTALEILAKRYKALQAESVDSVVRLGRRVLELEFAENLKTDTVFAAKLKEAKTPEALASVRESIQTKKVGPKAAATEASKASATNVPPTNESKEKAEITATLTEAKVSTSTPVTESKDTGKLGTIVVPVGNPRNISESIAIARRLSTSSSQQ